MTQNNPDTIGEANRYLTNAKETIGRSAIVNDRYSDSKYVKEAAGIAYLSALKAIDVYMISLGMDKKKFPKSFDGYAHFVRNKMPHNGKLMDALNTVYENLHILAYYRGGTDVKMVKSGFEKCKKIIEMIDGSLGTYRRNSAPSQVNEPEVKYRVISKKKKARQNE